MLNTEKQKYRRITPQNILSTTLSISILLSGLTACGGRPEGRETSDQAGSNPTTSLEIYNRFYNGTPTPSPYPTFGVKTPKPTETLPTIEPVLQTVLPTIQAVTATVVKARKTNTPVALTPDPQELPSDLKPIAELTPLNETRFTGCAVIQNVKYTQWVEDGVTKAIVTFECSMHNGDKKVQVRVIVPYGIENPAVGWKVLRETRDGEKHTITLKNGDGVEVEVKVYDFWNL